MPEHRTIPAPAMTQAQEATQSQKAGAAYSAQRDEPSECARKPMIVAMPPESEADRQARERLAAMIPAVEFPEGTGLGDMIEFLQKATKVSIAVNWNVLSIFGVDRTSDTGGINLHNVSGEKVLEILLANVGGVDVALGYDVSDGIVLICTPEELALKTITRVYNVQPLLDVPLSAKEQQAIDDLVRRFSAALGGRQTPETARAEQSLKLVMQELHEQDAARLVTSIKQAVVPGTWAPDGGLGRIELWKGRLIVTHRPQVHREVLALLQMLLEVGHPSTQPANVQALGP
jgi:hypothetical protein